jgi:hypothetical protein
MWSRIVTVDPRLAGGLMARPTSLDDLVRKRILDAARRGNTRECSAVLGGVDVSTLRRWVRRGRDGEEIYARLLDDLELAEREAEDEMVQLVRSGAERWQSAAWWLERRRRGTWRRPPQEKPTEVEERDLGQASDEELEAAVRAAQELRARRAG